MVASLTTSIAVDGDAVWFVGDSSTRLWRIDAPSVSTRDSDRDRGKPQRRGRREEDGTVWVAGRSVTSLWRLDPGTDEDETIPLGATSGGLVADFGRIWTSPGAAAG